MPHYLIDGVPLRLVQPQHALNQVPELAAVNFRDTLILTFLDLEGQGELVLSFERWPQCGHLVGEAAQRPDVTLLIVALLVDLLGAHVVRRADVGLSVDTALVEHSCQTKVTQLRSRLSINEDISRFEVTVQDSLRLGHIISSL